MTDELQRGAPETLEEVADALVDQLLESMPAGGVYGRVALARLPGPVEHVLTAALERKVARETAPPATEWIDADDPDVRDAGRRWREAAQEAARYPPDAWTAALTDGTRQALRHLVEPADTAAAFCFAGETGPLPVATVRARMAAFGPYAYLREIAERYAERKGLDQIDRAGLTSLLRRIDRRMTAGYGAGEWDALLAPLYQLVGVLPSLHGELPADVVRRFFAARGADALAQNTARRPAWSAADLHDAIASVVEPVPSGEATVLEDGDDAGNATESAFVDEVVGSDPSEVQTVGALLATALADEKPAVEEDARTEGRTLLVDPEVLPGTDHIEEETAPENDVTVEMDRALAQHFGMESPAVDTPAHDSTTQVDDATSGPPGGGRDEALWKTFAAGSPPAAPFAEVDGPDAEPLWQRLARTHGESPSPDSDAVAREPLAHLEARVLGQNALSQRDWFVAHVAGGSEVDYRRLLEDLDAAPTWADAWPVLARLFKAHAVDIYSEPAVALTDAAEARFGP